MFERAVSNELEILNFKNFLSWHQSWWHLATFKLLYFCAHCALPPKQNEPCMPTPVLTDMQLQVVEGALLY